MNDLQMAHKIRQERQQREADEESLVHNTLMHREILKTWRAQRPQMVARLEKLGILDDLAFVVQERMWETLDMYEKSGMPPTDAREQAEMEHLMLEPEDES